jgi:cytochrome c556
MSVTFSFSRISVIAVSGLALCAVAFAADPVRTPAQEARHKHYHELGDAFKAVRDEANAASPDFDAIVKSAEVVNQASINQEQWFAKGTGPESGKTRALPEIWTKPEEFAAAQKMLSDRAPALLAAAKTKDVTAVMAAFKQVGGACKNCHDNFRSPEEHN